MPSKTKAPQNLPKTFEAWWGHYKPTGTPVDGSGPCIDDEQRMFETYGPDLETVTAAALTAPGTVWTLVDCDDRLYVIPGMHYVNRMGYYITEVPAAEGQMDLCVDDEDDD